MRQFFTIFRYEYKGVVKNRIYIGITLLVVILLGVLLSLPRILAYFESDDESGTENGSRGTVAIIDRNPESSGRYTEIFARMIPGYQYQMRADYDEAAIKEQIDSGELEAAILISGPLQYTYIVESYGFTDTLSAAAGEVLKQQYYEDLLVRHGATAEEAQTLLQAANLIQAEIVETGKGFFSSYLYTYVLMFLLYMAILLYGQMIANSVATEKSSRAMELLITTAKPANLMFGKVLGVGCAGLTQIAVFVAAAAGFIQLNAQSLKDVELLSQLVNMPSEIIVYTFVFFILGFLLYAFMFGALGSTVSRIEEMNTASMPIILLFVAAFLLSYVGMSTDANSTLMTVTSFIPFFTPMVMFVRICMGAVSAIQIAVSIAILVASTVGIGYLSARIYRVGVLMYGKPPKLKEVFKYLKHR